MKYILVVMAVLLTALPAQGQFGGSPEPQSPPKFSVEIGGTAVPHFEEFKGVDEELELTEAEEPGMGKHEIRAGDLDKNIKPDQSTLKTTGKSPSHTAPRAPAPDPVPILDEGQEK